MFPVYTTTPPFLPQGSVAPAFDANAPGRPDDDQIYYVDGVPVKKAKGVPPPPLNTPGQQGIAAALPPAQQAPPELGTPGPPPPLDTPQTAPQPQTTAPQLTPMPTPPKVGLLRRVAGNLAGILGPDVANAVKTGSGYQQQAQQAAQQNAMAEEQAKLNTSQAQADYYKSHAAYMQQQAKTMEQEGRLRPIVSRDGTVIDPRTGQVLYTPSMPIGDRVKQILSVTDPNTGQPLYTPEEAKILAAGGKGSDLVSKQSVHVLPDGTVIGVTPGQSEAQVLYKGNPAVQTTLTDIQVNGKSHQVLVNRSTGEIVKDLGESGTKPQMQGPILDPAAVDFWAKYAATTGQLPSLGMGSSGAAARGQILNRAPQLASADVAAARAENRSDTNSLSNLQKMRDAVVSFEKTANANLDVFSKAAKPIIDSGSPLVNQPLRSINRNVLGSRELAAYDAARRVALNEVAKVVSNPTLAGQLSDAARREVESIVPENATLGQLYQVVNVLKQDMANRHKFLDQGISEIRGRLRGVNPVSAPTGSSPTLAPIVQQNRRTGEYRYSVDGGKTWLPGRPQ